MHVHRLALALVCFGLCALSLVPSAHAQTEPSGKKEDPAAMARRFFNSGQKAFTEGRFTDAARAFEEAFRLKPHPAPLINAGDAWEKAGEYAQAARTYQRVLDMPDANEQDRGDAVDRLARLSPKLGVIELKGDASVRARVDDDEFPGGSRVYVFPGEHKVTLIDVDDAKVRTLEVAAGTTRSVDLTTLRPGEKEGPEPTTRPTEVETTPDGPPEEGKISPVTWVAYGVAALGVGGAVYFGLQVNDAEDSYNADPNRDDLDRFNQNKLFTNISLGVAAVGAGVGTYFLIQGLSGKKKKPEPVGVVDVTPVSGGAMVLGRGRF